MLRTITSFLFLIAVSSVSLWGATLPSYDAKKSNTRYICSTEDCDGPGNKCYLAPEQIEIHETTILVHLGEMTYEADALHADQGGIYALQETLRCTQCRRSLNLKNICENPRCSS